MNTEEFLQQELNRRQFLGSSARNAAGMAAGMVAISGVEAAGSPAETVSLGLIGCGSRGRELATELTGIAGVRLQAVCDIDSSNLACQVRRLQESQGIAPRRYSDFRQLLDDPSIDAVLVATPDHWHALMTVLACDSGKHVYIEPPLSHSLEESTAILAAARNSGRVVMCGLQQRSGSHFQSAVQAVRSGTIGRVAVARAWTMHRRKPLPVVDDSAAAPEGVDYDLWLGPAPARPFNRNRFHQHWRWFSEYGSGELGQWGVHMLDLARWGLNVTWPHRVSATSGQHVLHDARETPDTMQATFDYDNCTILWEQAQWSPHGLEGRSAGVAFYGEQGTLIVDRGGWKVYDVPEKLARSQSPQTLPHLEQFIAAIRHEQPDEAALVEARISSDLCHLATIAAQLRRDVKFDPDAATFPRDAAAAQLTARPARHGWELPNLA